jgi:aminoglycoside phosphotransferase (APT) family kinase protein
VAALERPAAGWANETVLVTMSWREGGRQHDECLVVRLPTEVPSFPRYDLAAQARVLEALADAGLPAPRPIAMEPDARWLGAPFLVMPRAEGRAIGDAPALDPWLTGAPLEAQRRVHEQFLTTLAAMHRVDWAAAGLATVLRGAASSLRDEVDWWIGYHDWASAGSPTSALLDVLAWCRETAPTEIPPLSLLWGDARLGNVMYDDDHTITAVLDWEMATIGPAEMDLAWDLALEDLVAHFMGASVPGFLSRDQAIAGYERCLGRAVLALEWHEVFALTRSIAINDRLARMAAETGIDYPGSAGNDSPMLRYTAERISRFRPEVR